MTATVLEAPKPAVRQPGEQETALVDRFRAEAPALEHRLAPLREQMDTLGAEMSGMEAPAVPQLQEPPQFQARQVDRQEMMNFAGLAMAFSALAAKAVRGDVALAMGTAASAMEGFNKGNLQQAKLDIENFNASMKGAVEKNKLMLDEYNAVLNNRKITLGQKMQQYNVLANKYQDEIAMSALRKGDIRFELERMDRIRDASNQLEARIAQMQTTFQAQLARLERQSEPLVSVKNPDGSVTFVPRSQAIGREPAPSNQNRPPPAEIMRMNVALGAMGTAIDNYERLLQNFDPRGWDQLSPEQRAKMESAVSALQLEWKEAAALGALTGPDLEIMEKTIVGPTSLKGAFYGKDGLTQQIQQGREYIRRRQESIKNFYPDVGAPKGPGGGGDDTQVRSLLQRAGQPYEPAKYEYRVLNGQVQRRPRGR